MKQKMTVAEHRHLGSRLKQEISDALERYIQMAGRFPLNHPVVRRAESAYKALEKLRSALDDEICSFPRSEVPNPTHYYYGETQDSGSSKSEST